MPDNNDSATDDSAQPAPADASANGTGGAEASAVEISELVEIPEIQQNPSLNTFGAVVSIVILFTFVYGAVKSVSARELQNLSWVFLIIAAIFFINGMEDGHIGQWEIELFGSLSFGAKTVGTIALLTWAFLIGWARTHMDTSTESD